jgi:hypothetical protein
MFQRAVGAAGCILLCCSWSAAQESAPPRPAEPGKAAAAEPAEGAPKRIEEAQPPLYYLRDKQGVLQPVPNFTLDDFEQLYKLKHQLVQGDQRPRYSLQQMSAAGTVAPGGFAELSIQFRILAREAEWTRVPLRLDQAMLREGAQYEGKGEHFLHFEGEGEGYVAWLRGAAGQQHQLTLKMLVPLAAVGDETRLRLSAPRATASELKLKVPLADAVAKVSEGATLQALSHNQHESELTAIGLGGDFELSWYRPGARLAEVPTVLEASGTIAARLDGRGMDAEAVLSVRSFGAAFDRLRVRLPPECELVPGTAAAYSVATVDEKAVSGPAAGAANIDEKPAGGTRQRLVEVRLAKRSTGPVEVCLAASRALDSAAPGTWIELSGFEVLGAARQWGTIAVSAVGDWQVLWGPNRGVRQIDQLPESLRRKDLAAGFDYLTQPCSLTARLVPRRTRISVEPEYVLSVERDQVRLEGKLRYTVRGAKVFSLDVDMPDWQLDEVGPESVVAVDAVPMGASGPSCSIPLAQPSAGQFEVRLRAHRPLAADARLLSVNLPQPQASAPVSAVVVVVSADNIELIPDGKAIVGLLRQLSAVPIELPARQQEALFYRSEAPRAVFAAELRRHAQRISVDVASQVSLDSLGGRVDQKLLYTIAYEPTDHLLLDVPRSVAESGRIELKHAEQVLPAVATDDSESPQTPAENPAKPGDSAKPAENPSKPGGDGTKPVENLSKPGPGNIRPVENVSRPGDGLARSVTMRVTLPKAYLGAYEVSVRYPLPPLRIAAGRLGEVDIPLVMPAEGELASNKLEVAAASEFRVESRGSPWAAVEAGPRPARHALQLAATQRTDRVELDVQAEPGGPAACVQRAWIQTWLSSEQAARQDRALLQFSTPRREVEVSIPADAALEQVDIFLDGKRAAATATAEGTWLIPMATDETGSRHLLELRYYFPGPRPGRGKLSFDFPRLGGEVWVRRVYWQLILPHDEHVIIAPGRFTGEFAWGWNGYCWGRQPLLDQAQLETWVGARPCPVPLPATANCYLFSTLGSVEHCELRTAGRSAIVLWASGAALLAGLLLIYLPVARHPATLLAATLLLAALGIMYPEPALLAAQAAGLGVLLALLAGLLFYGVGRRRRDSLLAERPSALGSGVSVPVAGPAATPTASSVPLPPPALPPAPPAPPPPGSTPAISPDAEP